MNLGTLLIHCMFQHLRRKKEGGTEGGEREEGERKGGREEGREGGREGGRKGGRERELRTAVTIAHSSLPVYWCSLVSSFQLLPAAAHQIDL